MLVPSIYTSPLRFHGIAMSDDSSSVKLFQKYDVGRIPLLVDSNKDETLSSMKTMQGHWRPCVLPFTSICTEMHVVY